MKEGYVHYFDRVFNFDGDKIDRLEQIKKHGILSPRKAKELEIPYERRVNVIVKGIEDYEDIIFLYPIEVLKYRFLVPGNTNVRLSSNIQVYTPEDMEKRYSGRWAVLSLGEVYTFGRIDPKYFTEINE